MTYNCISWNILAQIYSDNKIDWSTRLQGILNYLSQGDYDIICFQEVFLANYQELNLDKYDHVIHNNAKKTNQPYW